MFGSAHPSGINIVFGDGSVRHLQFSVDRNVFNAIGHVSDGSVLQLN